MINNLYLPSRAIVHLDSLHNLMKLMTDLINLELVKSKKNYDKIIYIEFIYATGSELEMRYIKDKASKYIINNCNGNKSNRIHIGHTIAPPKEEISQYVPDVLDGMNAILDTYPRLDTIYEQECVNLRNEGLIQSSDKIEIVNPMVALIGFDFTSDEEFYELVQKHYEVVYSEMSGKRRAIVNYNGNYTFSDICKPEEEDDCE